MKAYLYLNDGEWSYTDDDKDCLYILGHGGSLAKCIEHLKEYYEIVVYKDHEFK